MHLSGIQAPHANSHTQQLYRPLRQAIQTLNSDNTRPPQCSRQPVVSSLRNHHSRSMAQNQLKQWTLIPQNMHLVQTMNPLKRMKARSRSYTTISVQESLRTPIPDHAFQLAMRNHPSRRKEVVYDYEPNYYHQLCTPNSPPLLSRAHLQTRSRSLPYMPGQSTVQRIDMGSQPIIKQAVPSPLSNKDSATSIRMSKESVGQLQVRSRKVRKQKKEVEKVDQCSDYYLNCNRYRFNKEVKGSVQRGKALPTSPDGGARPGGKTNVYKYNLFSLLDQQTNESCSRGLCTKNELVASKIKKKW